jgi:hypothetical protein
MHTFTTRTLCLSHASQGRGFQLDCLDATGHVHHTRSGWLDSELAPTALAHDLEEATRQGFTLPTRQLLTLGLYRKISNPYETMWELADAHRAQLCQGVLYRVDGEFYRFNGTSFHRIDTAWMGHIAPQGV